MFLAKLPMTGIGIAMTLPVVVGLGRGYAEAGLVAAAVTVGSAVGSPVAGRMIDRYGLRRVIAACGVCSTVFWVSAPHLPYLALAALALPAGLLAVPASMLGRQFLAALVPRGERRAAFALDMILTEISFVISPVLVVVVTTQVSSVAALTGIGACLAVASSALWLANLPVRAEEEAAWGSPATRPRMREWLDGRLTAALLITAGALFTLIGTEIATVAELRAHGETPWTGVVIAWMSIASIAGGLMHGAVRRSLPQATLALLLGALVTPVGLFGHPWWVLAIALVPMNLMCTPTLASGSETVSHWLRRRSGARRWGCRTRRAGSGLASAARWWASWRTTARPAGVSSRRASACAPHRRGSAVSPVGARRPGAARGRGGSCALIQS